MPQAQYSMLHTGHSIHHAALTCLHMSFILIRMCADFSGFANSLPSWVPPLHSTQPADASRRAARAPASFCSASQWPHCCGSFAGVARIGRNTSVGRGSQSRACASARERRRERESDSERETGRERERERESTHARCLPTHSQSQAQCARNARSKRGPSGSRRWSGRLGQGGPEALQGVRRHLSEQQLVVREGVRPRGWSRGGVRL